MVIERYKSGFDPPSDFPFDDLSRPEGIHHTPTIHPVLSVKPEAVTVKGTMSAGKIKKRVGLFGIFSSNKVCIKCWCLTKSSDDSFLILYFILLDFTN